MKIHLNFNDELLSKQEERGSELLFGIAWENDGIYYPDNHWIDFGVVVIGWWFNIAIKEPEEIYQNKMSFMDGPYSIRVSYEDQENILMFEPEGLDVVWYMSIEDFRSELIVTAKEIVEKLSQMNINEETQNDLTQAISILETKIGS